MPLLPTLSICEIVLHGRANNGVRMLFAHHHPALALRHLQPAHTIIASQQFHPRANFYSVYFFGTTGIFNT